MRFELEAKQAMHDFNKVYKKLSKDSLMKKYCDESNFKESLDKKDGNWRERQAFSTFYNHLQIISREMLKYGFPKLLEICKRLDAGKLVDKTSGKLEEDMIEPLYHVFCRVTRIETGSVFIGRLCKYHAKRYLDTLEYEYEGGGERIPILFWALEHVINRIPKGANFDRDLMKIFKRLRRITKKMLKVMKKRIGKDILKPMAEVIRTHADKETSAAVDMIVKCVFYIASHKRKTYRHILGGMSYDGTRIHTVSDIMRLPLGADKEFKKLFKDVKLPKMRDWTKDKKFKFIYPPSFHWRHDYMKGFRYDPDRRY